jgi:predicted solute-binding protein
MNAKEAVLSTLDAITRMVEKGDADYKTAIESYRLAWDLYGGLSETTTLYDIAKELCHEQGMPWTDPRTGETFEPPKK